MLARLKQLYLKEYKINALKLNKKFVSELKKLCDHDAISITSGIENYNSNIDFIDNNEISLMNMSNNCKNNENVEMNDENISLVNFEHQGIGDSLFKKSIKNRKRAKINKRKLVANISVFNKKQKMGDHKINYAVRDDLFTNSKEFKTKQIDENNLKEIMCEFIKKQSEMMDKWAQLIAINKESVKEEICINQNKNLVKSKDCFLDKKVKKVFNKGLKATDLSFYYKEDCFKKAQSKRKETIKIDINKYKNNKKTVLDETLIIKDEQKSIQSDNKANIIKRQEFSDNQMIYKENVKNVLCEKKVSDKNTVFKSKINLNKISPKELYKRSIDASFGKKLEFPIKNSKTANRKEDSEETHIKMINYKPKKFIQTFSTESDLKDQVVTAKFAKDTNLIEQIKKQNNTKIRRLLGNQTEINVKQIFKDQVSNATNSSPNKFIRRK